MLRRILPDDGRQARIELVPFLLATIEHRLVDDFQNGQLGVEAGEPRRQRAPEADKGLLPGRVEFRCAVFVVNVHHDQQSGAVKPLDGGFQLLAALLDDFARGSIHDDPRGHAQAHVLEPDPGHESRLGLGNIVGEMLSRVAPGKTEPLADIGAGGQAIKAAAGHRRQRIGGGQGRGDGQAAGAKGGQAQKGTSVNRGQVRHNQASHVQYDI